MNKAMTRLTSLAISLLCVLIFSPAGSVQAQEPARPTFSTGVAVVPITALVRDSRNRIVRDLVRDDFQVLEQGQLRAIVDFNARSDAPLSVAFLFDTSGSMRLALNLEKGIWFIEHFISQMRPASDEAALFTFHKALRQEVPFTGDRAQIHRALGEMDPWGLTSLYDAIAETAKRLADRPAPRRAVIVISDGVDTSSALTPQEVSALASAIDVPVFVVAVVSPLDHPEHTAAVVPDPPGGSLSDLAQWTGGELLYITAPEQASVMTRELIATMRQQYFLAIKSSTAAGWYSIEVKTKRRGLTVRSRRGYFADAPTANQSNRNR